MNNYQNLKSLSLEELAVYIEEQYHKDDFPWDEWFNRKYCMNCPVIIKKVDSILYPGKVNREFAYCEVNDKCRYFPDAGSILSQQEIIKLWLQEEVETNN